MNFDRQAALDAGYTEAEIDAYLAKNNSSNSNFDREAAKAAGYTDDEIDRYLAGEPEPTSAPSKLESAGQILQQSAAGATTNKIKPMTTLEKNSAKSVFVDPVAKMFQEQYLKPELKTLYRVGGDLGLGMMGVPPLIAGTKAVNAVRGGAKDLANESVRASSKKQFSNFNQIANDILGDPSIPESVKQPVAEADIKIRDAAFKSFGRKNAHLEKMEPEDIRKLQNQVSDMWRDFFASGAVPKEYLPKDLPKPSKGSTMGALMEAASGPARAIGQRALKYGLGPAGAALTAKDIADAIESGDYADAAIQSAIAGTGMIPGIGLPLSLLGGLGYETYKHLTDKPKLEFKQDGGVLDPTAVTVVGEDGPEIIHNNQVYSSRDGKLDLSVLADLLGPVNAMATQASNTALMGLPELLISLMNPQEAEKYQQQREQYPEYSATGEFLGELSPQAKLKAALGGIGLAGIAGMNKKGNYDFFRKRPKPDSAKRNLERWTQGDPEGSGLGPAEEEFLKRLNVQRSNPNYPGGMYGEDSGYPFMGTARGGANSLNRIMNQTKNLQQSKHDRINPDIIREDMYKQILDTGLKDPKVEKVYTSAIQLGLKKKNLKEQLAESEWKLFKSRREVRELEQKGLPVPKRLQDVVKDQTTAYNNRKETVKNKIKELEKQETELAKEMSQWLK